MRRLKILLISCACGIGSATLAQSGPGGMDYPGPYGGGYGQGANLDPAQFDVLLEQLNKAQHQLANPGTAPAECAPAGTCTFRDLCLKLQSNRNHRELYRNSVGESLPNYRRYQMESALNQCFNAAEVARQQLMNLQEQTVAQVRQAQEVQSKITAAQRALTELVIKTGEAEKYFLVTRELLEMYSNPSFNQDGGALAVNWDTLMTEAQRRAGVTLSPEVLDAWKKTAVGYPSMGMGGGYGTMEMPGPNQPSLKAMKSTGLPYIDFALLEQPTLAGSKEAMEKHRANFIERSQKAAAIFGRAQEHVIGILEQRRSKDNSKQIDSLIERVKLLTFKVARGEDPACETPNAYYNPDNHHVVLCPQKLMLPEGALAMTLGHEIGHAVDPCSAAHALCRANTKQKSNNPDDSPEKQIDKLPTFDAGSGQRFEHPLVGASPAKYRLSTSPRIKKLGGDVPEVGEVIAEDIPFIENPFMSVINCLHDRQISIGARLGDPSRRNTMAQEMIEDLERSGAPMDLEDIKSLAKLRDLDGSAFVACSQTTDSSNLPSQMQEAFSDWVGSEVLGRFIAEQDAPRRRQELAFEGSAFFAAQSCVNVHPELNLATIQAKQGDACFNITSRSSVAVGIVNTGPHPATNRRVDRVVMANARVREALGCEPPKGVKRCE